MAEATYVQYGDAIDYTPGADVAVGQVVVLNDLIGIAKKAIPEADSACRRPGVGKVICDSRSGRSSLAW